MPEKMTPNKMTPTKLRELIATCLNELPEIDQVSNTGTILIDRIALNVFDNHGFVWRVHVLKDPRPVGESAQR